MSKSEFTLNAKEAIGDFRKYDAKTQKRFKATLATFAQTAAGEMKGHLRSKVKNWRGHLGGSIVPEKKENGWEYDVGPDANKSSEAGRVVYAWFIEEGAPPGMNNSFKGYHYVRDGLKAIKDRFFKALKKDIERP
jgi:hypothetical protein